MVHYGIPVILEKGNAMGKTVIDKEKLICNMAENLPALRAQLDLTQEELAGNVLGNLPVPGSAFYKKRRYQ